MPSLSEATPRQWARMRSSTSMVAYALLDKLFAGPIRSEDLQPYELRLMPDLLVAEWIAEDVPGVYTLTEDGRRERLG